MRQSEPEPFADNLDRLQDLNDVELWKVVRETLPPEHFDKMDDMLDRKNQGKITASEQDTIDLLLEDYHRLILRRGQAAVLLKARGYDVSDPASINNKP